MLKSPRSTRDLSLDGDCCSSADSTSASREALDDGGHYKRPHTTLDLPRGSSTIRTSALLWETIILKYRCSWTYSAMPPPW